MCSTGLACLISLQTLYCLPPMNAWVIISSEGQDNLSNPFLSDLSKTQWENPGLLTFPTQPSMYHLPASWCWCRPLSSYPCYSHVSFFFFFGFYLVPWHYSFIHPGLSDWNAPLNLSQISYLITLKNASSIKWTCNNTFLICLQ